MLTMNLGVVLALVVLLGDLCTAVEFFLEMVKPATDAAALIEKMITEGTAEKKQQGLRPKGKDEPFTVVLYECELDSGVAVVQSASCISIYDPEQKRKVYEVKNFYGVSDLKQSFACTINIGGIYFNDQELFQALAVSIQPRNLLKPHFEFNSGDKNHIEDKTRKFLDLFIKHEENSKVERLVDFFSVNHIRYFYDWKENSKLMVAFYVSVMEKLIKASGYNTNLDRQSSANPVDPQSPDRSLSQTRTPPRSQSPVKPQSQSSFPRSEVSIRKSTPQPPRSQSLKKCLSQRLLSLWSNSEALLRSRSRSRSFRSQSLPKSKSRPWFFAGSRAKVTPQPQTESVSASSTLRSSRSPPRSEPQSQPMTSSAIQMAADFLSFKMFDPCLINWIGILEQEDAENYCTTYCQFLSMTIRMHGQGFPKLCYNLVKGQCKGKCVCLQKLGAGTGDVNMVFCNNALRLHMYQYII